MSQGLLQQQLLQQQQLQQQLLLTQQIQQHQQLQTAQMDRQMRDLASKGPDVLKSALRDANPQTRLMAALTVAKYGPDLTDELIDRLTDDVSSVRQAARQGLVGISKSMKTRDGKPMSSRGVDFGPAPQANRTAQKTAARKWHDWFQKQQERNAKLKADGDVAPVPPGKEIGVAPVAAEDEAPRLGKELIDAPANRREAVLTALRDRKGVAYTEALADAIPQLTGEAKSKAREALAERMARMTAATLREKLRDADPEVRRAAALAVGMKELTSHIPDLIALLEDPAAAVPPAARAALKSLTNQDFGPVAGTDRAEQTRVAAAWRDWLQKQGGQ
jgi:HEAT repeat protein